MIDRGNVTTYEWTYGEPPLSVEEPKLDFGDDDEKAEAADGVADNVEIDFDVDLVDLSGVELEAPVDIDWGDLEVVNDDDDADVKIDWDAVDIVPEVQVNLLTVILL